jgi:hypothetical protein
LSLGAQSIEVERQDSQEWVFARKGGVGISIANYESSGTDAKELRRNLYAAAKKPVRIVIGGLVYIVKVRVFESFGDDAFEVSIDPAPRSDPSISRSFTAKQGQYLAFIYNYTKIHRRAPAESDMERYFQVSPPTIHNMIKTLERQRPHRKNPWKGPIHSPRTTGAPAAIGVVPAMKTAARWR